MPIDLFRDACKENVNNHEEFGICDGLNGEKAYTDTENRKDWVATVINRNRLNYQFMAVDNCIELRKKDGNMGNRCDGLLMYKDNIVFIELKDERINWVPKAVNQLESTIRYFSGNRKYKSFKRKRAYACNKRHPQFHYSHKQLMQDFYKRNSVILNIEANINI